MITIQTDREQTLDRLVTVAERAMMAEPVNVDPRARHFIASLSGLMQARGETAIEQALDELIGIDNRSVTPHVF